MKRDNDAAESAPQVAALVLAAGLSSRMAPVNKLLVRDQSGLAMIARVVQVCSASRAVCLFVVIGHQASLVQEAVCAAVPGATAQFVYAADYRDGLSASLQAGIAALPEWIDGALICLGDMPLVEPELIDSMIAAFAPSMGRSVVVPRWRGQRGNPILWDKRHFPEIRALSGDVGARALLDNHAGSVVEVEAEGPGITLDFDSPNSLSGTHRPVHRTQAASAASE